MFHIQNSKYLWALHEKNTWNEIYVSRSRIIHIARILFDIEIYMKIMKDKNSSVTYLVENSLLVLHLRLRGLRWLFYHQ